MKIYDLQRELGDRWKENAGPCLLCHRTVAVRNWNTLCLTCQSEENVVMRGTARQTMALVDRVMERIGGMR